jgi:hypothetical protein
MSFFFAIFAIFCGQLIFGCGFAALRFLPAPPACPAKAKQRRKSGGGGCLLAGI